jgi:hypothetical protein
MQDQVCANFVIAVVQSTNGKYTAARVDNVLDDTTVLGSVLEEAARREPGYETRESCVQAARPWYGKLREKPLLTKVARTMTGVEVDFRLYVGDEHKGQ